MTTATEPKATRVQEMKNLAAKLRADKETKAQLNKYWAGAAAEQAALDELLKFRGSELEEITRMDATIFEEAGIKAQGLAGEASDILAGLASASAEHQELAKILQKGDFSDAENLIKRMQRLDGISVKLQGRIATLLNALPR